MPFLRCRTAMVHSSARGADPREEKGFADPNVTWPAHDACQALSAIVRRIEPRAAHRSRVFSVKETVRGVSLAHILLHVRSLTAEFPSLRGRLEDPQPGSLKCASRSSREARCCVHRAVVPRTWPGTDAADTGAWGGAVAVP